MGTSGYRSGTGCRLIGYRLGTEAVPLRVLIGYRYLPIGYHLQVEASYGRHPTGTQRVPTVTLRFPFRTGTHGNR
jgi:hypothetical protein